MAKSSSEVQLLELKDTISQLNTTIKMLNETINRQQKESDNLKAELAWFRQKMFGASSERRIDDFEGQLSLFDEIPFGSFFYLSIISIIYHNKSPLKFLQNQK